jgi:hypothetical protein
VKLGRPAVNIGEAATLAVQWRHQGLTIAQIAKHLNDQGYTTARGGQWHASSVYYMIGRTDPTANPVGGYGAR